MSFYVLSTFKSRTFVMDLIAPKSPAVSSGIIRVLCDFPMASATSICAFNASRATTALGFFF